MPHVTACVNKYNMSDFQAAFDLTCAYARLSPEEREAAWSNAHTGHGNVLSKAARNYRAIAASLTLEEILLARKSANEEK